ncbi:MULTISPECIES: KasA/KasB family beta-ketoacyl-ACP synthase [unclassified Mycobacterium]|uniref:KasA/KasB family beta-ketoacyl-ACP synthase n=1 Tax=unclassified Mycobacterium TaxID=2642494 RepID=UPI0029C69B8A|nr:MULTISPECIES: KasA/KasB family beta-ketoacyl-ACP synthase [unclassified Mycobacterium]
MKGSLPDVVVTGIAMSTAVASDAEETWTALLDGQSGVRLLGEALPAEIELPTRMGAGILENFDGHLNRVELRRLSYLQKVALVLSRRVWEHCGSPDVDPVRLGVSIGTGYGATQDVILAYHAMRERGMKAVSPLAVQMFMPNGPAATVGLDRAAKAGVTAPLMGDASGNGAVAAAWRQIVFGEADMVICGGVEDKIEPVPIAAYSQLDGVLSTDDADPKGACRPFDRSRTGMVLGEGGGLLVIETEEHAKARGATILARLLGAAMNSDGYDLMFNDPGGEQAAAAVTRAIELAGLKPSDIDHVNANAAGTVRGDLAEAVALQRALGGSAPAVYASKAALGHSFGASGGIESALTVLALRDGIVPPTLNFHELDPGVELDVVAGQPRRGDYRYAVNTSLGFGGHNVAVVYGKY